MIKKKNSPADKYLIKSQIGSGSYGNTFKVTHKESGQVFCKKSIQVNNQENIEKVLEEGKILTVMDHVNVVKLNDSFFENGNYVIIMEFAENGDLFQKIENQKRSGKPFSDFEIMHYFCQLVIALNYIHSQNIIHRDIKPKNIVLSSSGSGSGGSNDSIPLLKIVDFGVSKLMSETDLYANTTAGTPQYVSYEICNKKPYTNKTDIWSLGVVLYELMTLSLPFDGRKETVMRNIQTESTIFKPVNHPNEELSSLLFKLLNKNPELRFSTQQILEQVFIRKFIENHLVDFYKRFNFSIDGIFKVISKKLNLAGLNLTKEEKDNLEHKFIFTKMQEMKDRMKAFDTNHINKTQQQQQQQSPQKLENNNNNNNDNNNNNNNNINNNVNYNVLKKVSVELGFNLDNYCYDTDGMLIELVRSKLEGKDRITYSKCYNYLNNKQSAFTNANSEH
ncbi:hypothetical protein ACTFIR_010305 [Dictyostelium discoideum]